MSDQVFIKLIRGYQHTCPNGTIITKKKALPVPSDHPLVMYAKTQPRKFQVIESVSRKPDPRRRRKGGRGGRALPPVIERPAEIEVEFGAPVSKLMKLTRALLIERNAKFDLGVSIRKSASKKVLAQEIHDAEQEQLEEPGEEEEEEETPRQKRTRKSAPPEDDDNESDDDESDDE